MNPHIGERQKRILKEIEERGYYKAKDQIDLCSCRRLWYQSIRNGMKRIKREGNGEYSSVWYIFSDAGISRLIKEEDLTNEEEMMLTKYGNIMLGDEQNDVEAGL